jgi:hypothetical protein
MRTDQYANFINLLLDLIVEENPSKRVKKARELIEVKQTDTQVTVDFPMHLKAGKHLYVTVNNFMTNLRGILDEQEKNTNRQIGSKSG